MERRRRLDLYAECNVEPRAPLDVFTAECCSRCVNPDCSRSQFADSRFEGRITTWYERLFSEVPRMLPDDPRFGSIAGQKFLLIDPASSAAISGWVDPRDLESAAKVVVPAPSPAPAPAPAPAPPMPPPVAAELPAEQAMPAVAKAPTASPDLAFKNTPAKQGQMLGNRPKPGPAEWQSLTPEPPSDARVVKTGARIKLGS